MKRILGILVVLFVLSIASVSAQNRSRYKVGDYYADDTKEGVVFWVKASGRHGKLVSLVADRSEWCTDEQYQKYIAIGATSETDGKANTDKIMARADSAAYPAVAWCRKLGKDWYLPAIEELMLLMLDDSVRNAVNKTLESLGAKKLHNVKQWEIYWSSTEVDESCVWGVYMNPGNPNFSLKYGDDICVRAVATF